MKPQNPKKFFSLLGSATLFLTIAVIIMIAVLVYAAANESFGGNNGAISLIMLTVIVFFSFACILIDGIRRKITVNRPVERILEATERIASGDFSVRLEPSHSYGRYNEFDRIMENLNRMAAELSKNEVLGADFVSNVSHELKTPLAIIQNYSMALKGDVDRATREKYADALVSASRRLTVLVSDILKLNKLENQEIKTEKKVFRLDESIAESVLQFEDRIEQKKLSLSCDLDEISVCSDPNYLEIVWNNLISNAVKFTEENGRISVSLKRENGRAVVKVSDTGCGISKETGEHIFEKFYQGDTSHSAEGNGLGLALVKKVIDVLGGEISVESEPGKGSTFVVKLRGETG